MVNVKLYAHLQFQVLCPKAQFIIKNKLCDFIWNGKRPKIISDYQDGGIKLSDIETKIKTQQLIWIKTF